MRFRKKIKAILCEASNTEGKGYHVQKAQVVERVLVRAHHLRLWNARGEIKIAQTVQIITKALEETAIFFKRNLHPQRQGK